jgi:phenylacetate-CoA ligase
VKYSYDHVGFYREKFKQLGIGPYDIKTAEDLGKLPILRKEELLANADRIVSDEFDPSKLEVESTSGSTGRPLSVRLTKKESEFRKAKLLRANISCGQKPRDKWVVLTPPQHGSRASSIQRLLGVYFPISISVFDEPAKQLSAIQKIRPSVLEGYSSSLLLIARQIEKVKEACAPRIVIGGAELVDVKDRQFIEESFGAPFIDQYSSVEFDSLSFQCQAKDEYHIDSDTVVMQFVDENGDEVSPGEEGEIVCTGLFNYAMPFIKYAIGDIGVLSEKTECSCGITLPLMKLVSGRRDSIIVLPEGRSVAPLVIGDGMMYFKYFNDIDQYRVVQKKVDFFRILVKTKGSVNRSIFEIEFEAHFKRLLGLGGSDATVEMEFVDEIPLDKGGKLRKVISELNSNKH